MTSIKDFVGQIIHVFSPQKLIDYISGILDENNKLKVHVQDLEDKVSKYKKEINELIGEQGKPEFKKKEPAGNKRLPSIDKDENSKGRENNKKTSKLDRLIIDDKKIINSPKIKKKKGFKTVIIQDIIFTKNVTQYQLECGYDENGDFLTSPLPITTFGEYGTGLTSFVKTLYYQGRVPMNKIQSILKSIGFIIGKSVVVKMCHFSDYSLKKELDAARIESVLKNKIVQMDDTEALVGNKNHHTFAISTDHVTILTTMESKSMMSAIYAYSGGNQVYYLFNDDFFNFLEKKLKFQNYKNYFKKYERQKPYDEIEFRNLMKKFSGEKFFNRAYFIRICALKSWIKNTPLLNPNSKLVSDTAGNYKFKGRTHQYCWIHEIRHYRRIEAFTQIHKDIKLHFLTILYDFYNKLKKFKIGLVSSYEVETDFDHIMNIKTNFSALDNLLENTKKRKEGLLTVLKYPFVPLHNNTCEQDLRENVIKIRVSGGTKTRRGTYSWDVGLSLVHTLRKLKISYYKFLMDRYSQTNKILPLGQIIQGRA